MLPEKTLLASPTEDVLRDRVVALQIPWWQFVRTALYEEWATEHGYTPPQIQASASTEALLEAHRARERALGGRPFDETKHPRHPAGSEQGGEFRAKGLVSVDYGPARKEFDQWVAQLESYYSESQGFAPDYFPTQAAATWDAYQKSVETELGPLRERLEQAGVSGVVIRPELSSASGGDLDAIMDPERTHTPDFDVSMRADPDAHPSDRPGFSLWTFPPPDEDVVEDIIPLDDTSYFPGGPESDTAAAYVRLLDAAANRRTSSEPVTMYRGMSDTEIDAWEAGEDIPAGKFFTSKPTTSYALDVPGQLPVLQQYRIPRDMLIEVAPGEFQLRKRARMRDGRIEAVTGATSIPYNEGVNAAAWDESKHPRDPGGEGGGQFIEKGTTGVDGGGITETQRRAYDKGWRAGQNPSPGKVAAADARREHSYWYIGFFDAENGATKYAGIPSGEGGGQFVPKLSTLSGPGEITGDIRAGLVDYFKTKDVFSPYETVDRIITPTYGKEWMISKIRPRSLRQKYNHVTHFRADVELLYPGAVVDPITGRDVPSHRGLVDATLVYTAPIPKRAGMKMKTKTTITPKGSLRPMSAAAWEETKHPRHPRGSDQGGEFAPKTSPSATFIHDAPPEERAAYQKRIADQQRLIGIDPTTGMPLMIDPGEAMMLQERLAESVARAQAEAAGTYVRHNPDPSTDQDPVEVVDDFTDIYLNDLADDLQFEQDDGDPNGIADSISEELAHGASVQAEMRDAIETIAEVHKLPEGADRIELLMSPSLGNNTWGQHYAEQYVPPDVNLKPRMRSRHITVNPTKSVEEQAGTMTHEFGHYVDVQIGDGSDWWSDSEEALAWRDAVANSEAVQTLKRYHSQDPVYVDYLLTNQELWARSYAQWIAQRSGNAKLMESVRHAGDMAGLPERQWDDVDFGPIATAIDAAMERWRQDA